MHSPASTHSLLAAAALWICCASAAAAPDIRVEDGVLVSLRDASGADWIAPPDPESPPIHLHRLAGEERAGRFAREDGAARVVERGDGFPDAPDARLVNTWAYDADAAEWTLEQRADHPGAGLWGVEWSTGRIPLDYRVIVPAHSGLKLDADTPGSVYEYDYPMMWEVQFVMVEGPRGGFYVWAEDAAGRFKRLVIHKGADGWRLRFLTINDAPFAGLVECVSVRWRIGTYTGDWRVPARRYRDWAVARFEPVPVARQRPAWVRDIRCYVIMQLDPALLETLPQRLDPAQTLLYVPDWRAAGYDRDYPAYDAPRPEMAPFVERAHALGFRVMLHVNYFGVDPLNPLYEEFEPYQARDPWGAHDKLWWLWERADPVIKFAYINPAHAGWRRVFVERMKTLCDTYGIDALHLDQTLCIFNDHNGRIDGLTMADGNRLLHEELRAALPDVALSGEGLNEITYRHEAFAQRHAWGIRHSEGTWSRPHLATAHPIASFFLRPYTVITGYIGHPLPTQGQLYAAWGDAFEHWGVIPTLRPDRTTMEAPEGFARQLFEEIRFWQETRLDVALEDPWPPTVAFPFRTASGDPVVRTVDHRLLAGDREISRTVTGVAEIAAPGSIPGWHAYDADRIIGLDPDRWYPYFPDPRPLDQPHVARMPDAFRLSGADPRSPLAVFRFERADRVAADLAALLPTARRGSRPFEGPPVALEPGRDSTDGSFFTSHGAALHAHPPWKPGTGVAYAAYDLDLPEADAVRFSARVAIADGAVENSDGILFGVSAVSGDATVAVEQLVAGVAAQEIALDLSPFAGGPVTLELTVHPGPDRNPSFDWGRWYEPRVVVEGAMRGEVALGGLRTGVTALAGGAALPVEDGRAVVPAFAPGAVFLLDEAPPRVTLPVDCAARGGFVSFFGDTGQVLESPRYARAAAQPGVVRGEERRGLYAHPPDQGRTVYSMPMTLPDEPALFRCEAALRDGSESRGVVFQVEVNGVALARASVKPDELHALECDLGPWAGRPVVLSLVTDADGDFICDWAQWIEPTVLRRP